MPPRKQPKEQVYYPPSKRKAPPFRPLRPSKAPRIATTESESSSTAQSRVKDARSERAPATTKSIAISDSEDDDEEVAGFDSLTREAPAEEDQPGEGTSSEDLAEDPLNAPPPKKPTAANAFPLAPKMVKRKHPPPREPSPDSSDHNSRSPPPALPSQSASTPSIPQPLLIRLLHESFRERSTKIDRHAVQVVQRYFEVFVREAIARAAQRKREAASKGEVDEADASWLELEDLEKVAPGMMLDF